MGFGNRQQNRFGKAQGDADGGRGGKGQDDGGTTVDEAAIIDELIFMLQEEKLAGDLYEAFYEQTGLKIFDRIAASEDKHMDALVRQAEALGVDVDAFVLEPTGSFVDPELQVLYDTLLAQGSVSPDAALEVGVLIETRDMVDLAAAAEAVEGTALEQAYLNLLAGSASHLDAFEGLLAG